MLRLNLIFLLAKKMERNLIKMLELERQKEKQKEKKKYISFQLVNGRNPSKKKKINIMLLLIGKFFQIKPSMGKINN